MLRVTPLFCDMGIPDPLWVFAFARELSFELNFFPTLQLKGAVATFQSQGSIPSFFFVKDFFDIGETQFKRSFSM